MNINSETILLSLMNRLLYISDDEVQSQHAAKCNLLVHIGLDTFQYAVIDHIRDQLKMLAEYEVPAIKSQNDLIRAIESLSESSKEFKYSFNKIKVSFDTFNYTFIPSELYNQGDEEMYKKFISPVSDSNILINNIRSAEIKNIVAIDSSLNNTLNKLFNKPRIFNQATPFVEGIKKISASDKPNSLFIDVNSSHIQVGVLNNNKLLFYNIFDCINADELNYYLLSISKEFKLEATETEVILSGKIAENDELYQRVKKYFGSISFADSKPLVNYPEKFEEVKSHAFFSLMSLDLCE